jgi:hypothetical protein
MEVPSNWKGLIDQAIKQEAELLQKPYNKIEKTKEAEMIDIVRRITLLEYPA